MSEKDKRYLTSRDEIKEVLGIGDAVFAQFIKLQMPVITISGRYYAHADNIDAWFKSLTAKQRL